MKSILITCITIFWTSSTVFAMEKLHNTFPRSYEPTKSLERSPLIHEIQEPYTQEEFDLFELSLDALILYKCIKNWNHLSNSLNKKPKRFYSWSQKDALEYYDTILRPNILSLCKKIKNEKRIAIHAKAYEFAKKEIH